MLLFNLLVSISLLCAISAADTQIERQNNDNYESLNAVNRYKPTDSSSYSTSGGYYPRNVYEQINQNRYSVDVSGREFRPPNVFTAGLISTPTPYVSPLMAQPRQYQVSMSGPSGLMPYQANGSPLSSGYSGGYTGGYPMGATIGSQYSGLNGGAVGYGGYPTRLSIGDSAASMGQGYGNIMSDPYYGIGSRPQYAMSPVNPYSVYSTQSLYQSPYSAQSANYQPMMYSNSNPGYLNRGYSSYGFGPQYGGQSYQTSIPSPFTPGSSGQNTGYSNYNNYNSNTGLGSTQTGQTEGRDEKNYASSASTQTEIHSGAAQSSNDTPVFHSTRIIKRTDAHRSKPFNSQRGTE